MPSATIYYLGSTYRGYRSFPSRRRAESWIRMVLNVEKVTVRKIATGLAAGGRSGHTQVPVYEIDAGDGKFWMSASRRWFEDNGFDWTGEPSELTGMWGLEAKTPH